MMTAAPLFGLVLAGGASTRMNTDKATLAYHGRSQVAWAYELISTVCVASFVSVRPDQRDESTRASFPQIVDRDPGTGPLAGISAALLTHPNAAWLVVACDLPFLTEDVLRLLIEARDPSQFATAYRSAHDGLPEPLCAIWEPASLRLVTEHLASGKQCPRKLLINSPCKLLDLPDARALDNVNTPAEAASAATMLTESSTPASASVGTSKGLRVEYFAILREQAGRREELLDSRAQTAAELYEELRARHGFHLSPTQLKVAVNAEFRDWNAALKHGDTVVFIPPVAGG
jgi:molybdopterin-guanine dinucleotide biosynthesis protein A